MPARPWIIAPLSVVLLGSALSAGAAETLFFEGDMVRGAGPAGATGAACVLASQFKRREAVVWRIRVRDASGANVDAGGLDTLVVELPDGQRFPARFGPHPRGQETDKFWSVSWTIPADYPTGSFAYKVVATSKSGATQSWAPFKVDASQLTIIPGDVTFTK